MKPAMGRPPRFPLGGRSRAFGFQPKEVTPVKQRTVTSVVWTGHFESHELNLERIAPAIRYVCLAEGGMSRSLMSRYQRLCNTLRICFMVWSIGVAGFLAGCSG